MSALSNLEAEVAALDRTTLGAQLFRALRLAASAAIGYGITHFASVTGAGGISAVVGAAVVAGEGAFRSVFTVTATQPAQPASTTPAEPKA